MNFQTSHFLRLQDYIAEGSKDVLTPEERAYEDLLFTVCGLVRKEGRESARSWLINDQGCTRHVAERIVAEAVNLFFATDNIRQEAWRNLLFEKLLRVMRLWEGDNIGIDKETGEPICKAKAKDFEAYVKIVKQAAALKRLSKEDHAEGPTVSGNVFNIFKTDAAAVGMPATDRRAIINNPYFQKLAKRDQQRLAMEIGVEPMNIDTVMDNSLEIANEVIGE